MYHKKWILWASLICSYMNILCSGCQYLLLKLHCSISSNNLGDFFVLKLKIYDNWRFGDEVLPNQDQWKKGLYAVSELFILSPSTRELSPEKSVSKRGVWSQAVQQIKTCIVYSHLHNCEILRLNLLTKYGKCLKNLSRSLHPLFPCEQWNCIRNIR